MYIWGSPKKNALSLRLDLVPYRHKDIICKIAIAIVMAIFIINVSILTTSFHRFLSKIRVWVGMVGYYPFFYSITNYLFVYIFHTCLTD